MNTLKNIWDTFIHFLASATKWIWNALNKLLTLPWNALNKKAISFFTEEGRRGIYLNPAVVNFFVRPVAAINVALFFTLLLWCVDNALQTYVLDWMLLALITAFFTVLFAWSEGKMTVPEASGAVITFFGMRLRVYFTEGDYSWTGKHLFFGRSDAVRKPGTDDEGFVYLGDIQIPIWNSASEEDNTRLSNVSKNIATIYANLMIKIRLFDPYLWVKTKDPIFDVGERARSAFRTAISFFIDTDNLRVKSALGTLMSGKHIITAYTNKNAETHPHGSMIQDQAGVPMYSLVDITDDMTAAQKKRALKKAKDAFKERMTSDADSEMMKLIAKKGDELFIEVRSVDATLDEVLISVGAELLNASVSDLAGSQPVEEAANKAASEPFQQAAQIASAKAVKKARKILTPTKTQSEKPGYELATLLAAAQDSGNIKVVYVPGADRLTRAAVAAGSQIGDKS